MRFAGLNRLYNDRNYAIWLVIRYIIVCKIYPKNNWITSSSYITEAEWYQRYPQFKELFDFKSIEKEWFSFVGISAGGLESVGVGAIELIGSAIAGAMALGSAIDELNSPPSEGSGGAGVNLQAPASIYTSSVPPLQELRTRYDRLRQLIQDPIDRMDMLFAGEYAVNPMEDAFITEADINMEQEVASRDSLKILEHLFDMYSEMDDIEDSPRRNELGINIQIELGKLRELLGAYSSTELIDALSVFRKFSAENQKIGQREIKDMMNEINTLLRQRVRDINIPSQ